MTNSKYLIAGVVLGLGIVFAFQPVKASFVPHVTCHKTVERQCQEHTYQQSWCPQGWHTGGCPEVTPTPTITPTPTPKGCEEDCVTPTPTPEVTPVPVHVDTTHNKPGAPVAPTCPGFWPVGPQVFSFVRNSPTSISIEWHKLDSFVSDYVVYYGPGPEFLVWNKVVIGSEKTDLNDLPPNQSIWVTVSETNSGCVGARGNVIDP